MSKRASQRFETRGAYKAVEVAAKCLNRVSLPVRAVLHLAPGVLRPARWCAYDTNLPQEHRNLLCGGDGLLPSASVLKNAKRHPATGCQLSYRRAQEAELGSRPCWLRAGALAAHRASPKQRLASRSGWDALNGRNPFVIIGCGQHGQAQANESSTEVCLCSRHHPQPLLKSSYRPVSPMFSSYSGSIFTDRSSANCCLSPKSGFSSSSR